MWVTYVVLNFQLERRDAELKMVPKMTVMEGKDQGNMKAKYNLGSGLVS